MHVYSGTLSLGTEEEAVGEVKLVIMAYNSKISIRALQWNAL
jgi:hypothetical protein